MNKKIRNFGLVGLASAFLCTAMVGAALLPNVANADDTVAMSSLIGAKTDNVTVTAAQSVSITGDTTGTLTGLRVGPSNVQDSWSADINATFTDNATITYYLPQRTAYVANAFTVKNSQGTAVATFVIYNPNDHWAGLYATFGYLYNPATGKFTTQDYAWKTDGYQLTGVKELTLTDSTNAKAPLLGVGENGFVSPKFYAQVGAVLAADETIDGSVYFKYDNQARTLTVQTDSYKVAEPKGDTYGGAGHTLTMGVIENVDLSAGYTITLSDAPSIICTDNVEYDYKNSSAVLITAINGVDAQATTAPATVANEAISYAGEYENEGMATIDLAYNKKLNDFVYTSNIIMENSTNSSITLPLNGQTPLSYAGNKKFVANEQITVSYGTIEKQYQINVLTAASIAATDFIKPLTATATVEANKKVGSIWTPTAFNGGDGGTSYGLKVSSTAGRGNEAWPQKSLSESQFNGVFNGDTEIAFSVVCNSSGGDLPFFMVKDTQGNKVLLAVPFKKFDTWGDNALGRSYVFNYGTSKFTTSKGGVVSEITHWVGTDANDTNALSSGDTVLPNWSQEKGEKSWGRYLFDYDEVNKTMSVKAINTAGTYLTIGTVSCDLSSGYVISMGNTSALSIEEGNLPKSATAMEAISNFRNMEALYIMEVNGYSMASDTIGTDVFNQDIVCGDSNELDVVKGSEAPAFAYTSEFVLGSFVQSASETLTVDLDTKTAGLQNVTVTAANGYSEEFAITVKGLTDMLTETSAMAGAQMRISDPTGLRFGMTVGDDDMALIEANVGEGKYYTEVSYRMFIVPYAYAATYGHFTAENLFGEQAKYTWKGKTTASADGAVEIMERTTVLGMQPGAAPWENPEDYYLYFAITKLEGAALTAKFMGIGCVELTTEDGDKEYKVVSLYDTYVEDGDNSANNVRSVYDVAVAVYNDSEESLAARQLAYDFIATVEGENFTDERPVA